MNEEDINNEAYVIGTAQWASDLACMEAHGVTDYAKSWSRGCAESTRTAELTFRGHDLHLTVMVEAMVPDAEARRAWPSSVRVALANDKELWAEVLIGNGVGLGDAASAAFRKCMEAVLTRNPWWRAVAEAAELGEGIAESSARGGRARRL